MFDIVIKGGQIIDGSGKDPYFADLAILEDKIVAILDDISIERAKRYIDASSCLVTPGFIDLHTHSDYYLLVDNRAISRLSQGVTTDIGGNCGYSSAPVDSVLFEDRKKDYKEAFSLSIDFKTVDEYMKRLEAAKPAINFGLLAGYNTIRSSVVGYDDRAHTDIEDKKISDLLRASLREGAIGMSIGLAYPPGSFVREKEIMKALDIVAKEGKIFTSHIRSESDKVLESIAEIVNLASKSGCRLQISHLKTMGKKNWHKLDQIFEIIESAQDQQVKIMADRYPYLAANTSLSAILPNDIFDGGKMMMVKRLSDQTTRAQIRKRIMAGIDDEKYFDSIMISRVFRDLNREFEGKTVSEAAMSLDKDPLEFAFDLLIKEEGNVEAIYFAMNDQNMDKIYSKEWVTVASDSAAANKDGILSKGSPHPRTFGSFAKFWSEYVIKRKLFSYKEAVDKMAVLPAKFFNIKDRGSLKIGKAADIAVFNPLEFKDKADYASAKNYAVGMKATLVNGKVAYSEQSATDIFAGKVLRF